MSLVMALGMVLLCVALIAYERRVKSRERSEGYQMSAGWLAEMHGGRNERNPEDEWDPAAVYVSLRTVARRRQLTGPVGHHPWADFGVAGGEEGSDPH